MRGVKNPWCFAWFRSGPANQTKERPVHELFPGAFRKTKVRYVNRACFPKEKHQNSQKKWGEIHELFVLALLRFGLPGRLLSGFSCFKPKHQGIQGRTNPAFSKPCLFPSDTRHFRHFRRFRGFEEPNPCFQWVECTFVIFAVFVKTAPFWQGAKTRFTKNTVCATLSSEMEDRDRALLDPLRTGISKESEEGP